MAPRQLTDRIFVMYEGSRRPCYVFHKTAFSCKILLDLTKTGLSERISDEL